MLASTPHNPVTGTRYRGENREVLLLEQASLGYSSSSWYTYANARCLGRPVQQGETATVIRDPYGNRIWVFNEDQLVPPRPVGSASLVPVDLETDECVEWSIVQQDNQSHRRQLQQIQQELLQLLLVHRQLRRLLRQYLEQC